MDTVIVPQDAGERLRARLGIAPGAPLRLSYHGGTGDVVGTWRHWIAGRPDPRVPVVTYSAMFYELAERLGADAQIVTPWPSPAPDEPTGRLTFATVAPRVAHRRLRHIYEQIDYTRRCIAAVDRFDPHVAIVTTDFQPLGWPRMRRGRRLVLSAHNSFWPMGRRPEGAKGKLKAAILKRQGRAIDAAVCTSGECRRQIAQVTGGRIDGLVEVPQVVARYDPEERSAARRLLFLGRIEAEKGVFLLLDAFLRLGDAAAGLRLDFAGSGGAEEALRRRIEALGRDDIRFLGRLDSDGVHRQIAASDLVVCPTTSAFNEGLALVGFEAAAHGIPSLLSSVVPAAELLGEGCRVFAADDGEALAHALAALAADGEAYRALAHGVAVIRPRLYDRSQSWGSRLGEALLAL